MDIIPLIRSASIIMIPLLFAATGGLFTSLCGKLNIALEGLLLAGAFFALTAFHYTGSIAASLAAAVLSSVILSALHVFAVFKLRANVFVSGLAINLLSSGLCVILQDRIFNSRGLVTIGNISINHYGFIILILVLLVFCRIIIYKTPFGYYLRASTAETSNDKNSEALISLGLKPQLYQICAFFICAFFCGIGGAFLSLNLGAFIPGMSAGKGWIALVIIFMGGKKPQGVLAAAFILSLIEAFSLRAQGFWKIPADFLLAFPYLCTLIAMIVASIFNRRLQKNR